MKQNRELEFAWNIRPEPEREPSELYTRETYTGERRSYVDPARLRAFECPSLIGSEQREYKTGLVA